MTSDDIQGWVDDSLREIYRMAAKRAAHGGMLVEVGCWRGKSTAFMGAELIKEHRALVLYAVDPWDGSAGADEVSAPVYEAIVKDLGGDLYGEFMRNMEACGVLDVVFPMRMTSLQAATYFRPNALEFVFIDAAHDFDSVCKDIRAWYPLVRAGAIMAGHDRNADGVKRALEECFDEGSYSLHGECWIVEKPSPH